MFVMERKTIFLKDGEEFAPSDAITPTTPAQEQDSDLLEPIQLWLRVALFEAGQAVQFQRRHQHLEFGFPQPGYFPERLS